MADVESSSSSHNIPQDINLVITTTPESDINSGSPHIGTDACSTYSDSSTFPYTIRSRDVLATDVDSSSGTNNITASHTTQESVISSVGPEASLTMIATTILDDATFLPIESMKTTHDFVSPILKTTGAVSSSSTLNTVNLVLEIPNPSSDDSVSPTSDTMIIQSRSFSSSDIPKDVSSSFYGLSSDWITASTTTTEVGTTSSTDEMPITIPPDALDMVSTDEASTATTAVDTISPMDGMTTSIPPDALDMASTDEASTATTAVGTISPMDGMTTSIPPDALDTISTDEPSTTIAASSKVGTTSQTNIMTTTFSPDALDTASPDEPSTSTTAIATVGTPSTSLTDEMTTTILSDVLDTASTTINETTTWISGNQIFPNSECDQDFLTLE